MRTIAVFFNALGYDDYPFNEEEYRRAYHELTAVIAARGGQFSIVRGQETYCHGNTFRGGWTYRDGAFERREDEVTFDILFNKGRLRADRTAVIINAPELEEICTQKFRTYELFREFSMQTILVRQLGDVSEAFRQIPSDLVVAKPLDQEGGKGVFVGLRGEIRKNLTQFPYLLQELIDTTGGIPGIADGMHDLRIIAINGAPVLSYVRVPRDGSFLANESQGGRVQEVPLEALPQGALEVFEEVDAKLLRFPRRVYSVDLGLHRTGAWKIIELNSKPGLDPRGKYPGAARFMDALADLLLQP